MKFKAGCRRDRGLALAALGFAFGLTMTAASAGSDVPGDERFRIVSPEWVAMHADDPDVRILDVRTSVAAYQQGHVTNAVFLANDALRAPLGGVPVQYLDPEPMAALFQRAGIDRDDTVVVYGEGKQVLGATMVAYALHRIGHPFVAIMDGGIEAFADQYTLTQVYPDASPGDVLPALDRSMFITLDELRPLIGRDQAFILDTRPAAAYLGQTTRWIRNGHIPGAVNLDWRRFMDSTNLHRFRSVAAMRALVNAAGVTKHDDVILYCGTSREATLAYLVMRHVLGFPRVRLYEGSWTEYCAHPDLPVVTEGQVVDASGARALEPCTLGSIKRVHRYGDIFMAGQPTPEDFQAVAKRGIRTVINQRHERNMKGLDERAVVSELGMTYINLPWNGPEELTDRLLDDTLEKLRTAERPVLIHCSSANRTGATWLAFSVLDRGLAWEDALAEAKAVGLRTPAYAPIVKDYVTRRQAGAALDSQVRQAMLAGLDDERRARVYYLAVLDRYGQRRPFSNVIHAEQRHADALIALLGQYGVPVPPADQTFAAQDVPDTFAEACRLAVRAEERNIELYNRFLEQIEQEDVRLVMINLRNASRDRHLPAFTRHANR